MCTIVQNAPMSMVRPLEVHGPRVTFRRLSWAEDGREGRADVVLVAVEVVGDRDAARGLHEVVAGA